MEGKRMGGAMRNGSCWCGSGRKYKKCHMNREGHAMPSRWDMDFRLRKVYETKVCLHPEADAAACSRGIVRAHTVRRGADLRAIARKGHVYQGAADSRTLDKTGGRIIPTLVGINNASTFWGFCHKHDSTTF